MNLKNTITLFAISLVIISNQSNATVKDSHQTSNTQNQAQIDTSLNAQRHKPLADMLAKIIKESPQPFSGSILLMQNGVPLLSDLIGAGVSKQSQFVIASLSKQITATLILQAVDQGKIDLSATLNSYIGNTGYNEQITIHQLLSHTSGINTSGKTHQFAPGSQYRYSNLGYTLLSDLLELVNQQPYSVQLQQFAARYGIKHLYAKTGSLAEIVQTTPALALGQHEADLNVEKSIVPAELIIDEALLPAGGIIASIESFAQFQQLLHSGKLISKQSYQLMTQSHVQYDYMWSGMGYGYGLRINKHKELTEFGHTGYLPGYMSLSLHYPRDNIDLVMLENLSLNLSDFDRAFELHTQIRKAIRAYLIAHSE